MFTGIVQAVGRVAVVGTGSGGSRRLTIDTGGLRDRRLAARRQHRRGRRVPDGRRTRRRALRGRLSGETLARTTLGGLAAGSAVNLETALRAGDALGGHFVTGHVDGVARVRDCREAGGALHATIEAPAALARYVARKGSVTLDGVSLTVGRVAGAEFDVNLVPHTLAVTTLGALAPGARGEPRGRPHRALP